MESRRTGILRGALGFSDADYVIGIPALLRPERTICSWSGDRDAPRPGHPARALMMGDGAMRGTIEAVLAGRCRNDVVITGSPGRPSLCCRLDAVALCALPKRFRWRR
jgi:hypothetical protein